jgi:hypothetical protein
MAFRSLDKVSSCTWDRNVALGATSGNHRDDEKSSHCYRNRTVVIKTFLATTQTPAPFALLQSSPSPFVLVVFVYHAQAAKKLFPVHLERLRRHVSL